MSLKVGVFLIFLIKALRSISKRWFFIPLSMGAKTYSHHCIKWCNLCQVAVTKNQHFNVQNLTFYNVPTRWRRFRRSIEQILALFLFSAHANWINDATILVCVSEWVLYACNKICLCVCVCVIFEREKKTHSDWKLMFGDIILNLKTKLVKIHGFDFRHF